MAFTQQHFEQAAEVLYETKPETDPESLYGVEAEELWKDIVARFAGDFAQRNPRFDRRRFYAAAGYEEGS